MSKIDGIRKIKPTKFMRYGKIITGSINNEYINIFNLVLSIPFVKGSIGILAFL